MSSKRTVEKSWVKTHKKKTCQSDRRRTGDGYRWPEWNHREL